MNRHKADRLTARVRAWWTERRDRRDADDAEEAAWLVGLPDDEDLDIFAPYKRPGRRYQGRHAQPEDFGEGT